MACITTGQFTDAMDLALVLRVRLRVILGLLPEPERGFADVRDDGFLGSDALFLFTFSPFVVNLDSRHDSAVLHWQRTRWARIDVDPSHPDLSSGVGDDPLL